MADKTTEPMRIAFFGDSLTSGIPGSAYLSIMRRRLTEHTLINFGKSNDTAVSLHRRVAAMRFNGVFDLAFLWVGVNDVFGQAHWLHRSFNTLVGQRRARDLDEFEASYQASMDILCRHAGRAVAVSPLIRGEKPDNRWNRRGLRLTLDGLHMNSAGARMATEAFVRVIERRGPSPQSVPRRIVSDGNPPSAADAG
jgi:lysophospholipase L1-like esterase